MIYKHIERKRWKINVFFLISIIYVNYYLYTQYVLKEKLWLINKQLEKSSIGCFTLQGILSLAFDTISAAGKDFQSSESWSTAKHSKTPYCARQTKKSLWTCRIKNHLPLSASPYMSREALSSFLRPSMINKWSLERLYSLLQIIKKSFQKMQ